MTTTKRLILLLLIVFGLVLTVVSTYSIVSETMNYLKLGVQKQVEIVQNLGMYNSTRGSDVNWYEVSLDGNLSKQKFAFAFQVGDKVDVLVLPGGSDDMMLGRANDNIFVLMGNRLGGLYLGFSVIPFALFIVFVGSQTIWDILFNPLKLKKKKRW
ncbi:hypothetical protein RZY48_004100 [Vibrio navarrensis]|uniref:Uncharacterized protein n=1 Tax=Vibrio navarrensis TaxID=29495 RepID=A0AAI9CVE7_9VIBR|nr:hypothetical protein [Vibrio navarrensis]